MEMESEIPCTFPAARWSVDSAYVSCSRSRAIAAPLRSSWLGNSSVLASRFASSSADSSPHPKTCRLRFKSLLFFYTNTTAITLV